MLMSDRDIRAQIEAGNIGLEPLDMGLLQPSSFDVRLDRFFRLFDNHKYAYIDPAEEMSELTRFVEVAADEAFILHPSSLGRLGLLTHSTAGFVDPGFNGHVTLELANVSNLPIKLWPGMKVGQLCFFQLSSPSETPYGSAKYLNRYQGQRGPTASRSFMNFHITDVGNEPLDQRD